MTAFSPPWPETCWIVRPSTSAAKSATLTSSSFSGRMMAVMSFMSVLLASLSAGRRRAQGVGRDGGGRCRRGDENGRVDGRAVAGIRGRGDLVEVEALDLLRGGDAHADRGVEDLEEREAREADPGDVRDDPDQLGGEL